LGGPLANQSSNNELGAPAVVAKKLAAAGKIEIDKRRYFGDNEGDFVLTPDAQTAAGALKRLLKKAGVQN
jgi:hypothetical protein